MLESGDDDDGVYIALQMRKRLSKNFTCENDNGCGSITDFLVLSRNLLSVFSSKSGGSYGISGGECQVPLLLLPTLQVVTGEN